MEEGVLKYVATVMRKQRGIMNRKSFPLLSLGIDFLNNSS